MFSYSEDAARCRATLIGNAIAETCPDEFPCSHLDGKRALLTFAGHSGKIPPDAEGFTNPKLTVCRLTELPGRPHPPPNCDPAITPDISRCFRLVANGLRQRPQEQPHRRLHSCMSVPARLRACSVSSGSSHPGCFWRATASWCVVAGRLGASARLGRG
jgi:hypothetical protein